MGWRKTLNQEMLSRFGNLACETFWSWYRALRDGGRTLIVVQSGVVSEDSHGLLYHLTRKVESKKSKKQDLPIWIYCHIIEYSRTVKVKSHDQRSNLMTVNGVVTILSSPNQKARPYQKGEHSRTFEMTTLSGSRENTSTGSSWLNVHGYQRLLNSW